jgi:glycosyltransferase involved in cell wall biosynthesis
LLAAWPTIRHEVPEARLVLVGGGALDGDPELPPGVAAVGDQPEVTGWLHAADVVVAPSRWEGMSLGVLEAMASGRSVVAAEVEGMAEALGDEGTGALVPPEDIGALVAAVVPRLRDRAGADQEGRAGRARAERCFDVRRRREEVLALTLDVLSARR